MKNKFAYLTLFLAFWLLGNTAVAGTTPVVSPTTTHPTLSTPLDVGCDDFPAPNNFHVTGVGPASISLAWDPVNLASSYFLEVYVANSPFLVSTHTLYETSGTVSVPAGGNYDLYLAAVGEGCEEPSLNRAFLPNIGVIITELILDRMPPSAKEMLEGPQFEGCYRVPFVPETAYWFDIVYESPEGPFQYSTYEISLNCLQQCSPGISNVSFSGTPPRGAPGSWSTRSIGLGDGQNGTNTWGPPIITELEKLRVIGNKNFQELQLYEVTFSKQYGGASPDIEVCFCRLIPSHEPYSFRFYAAPGYNSPYETSQGCGIDVSGGGNIDRSGSEGKHQARAFSFTVQNPFNDAIHIRSNYTGEEPVQFELFNLNGQLVTTQKVTTAQEYNLPTSKLPPGMYVLHIKAGSIYQTRKLVKMH